MGGNRFWKVRAASFMCGSLPKLFSTTSGGARNALSGAEWWAWDDATSEVWLYAATRHVRVGPRGDFAMRRYRDRSVALNSRKWDTPGGGRGQGPAGASAANNNNPTWL